MAAKRWCLVLALLVLVGCTDDESNPPTCESLGPTCADDKPLLCQSQTLCICDPDGAGPEPQTQCTRGAAQGDAWIGATGSTICLAECPVVIIPNNECRLVVCKIPSCSTVKEFCN